MTAPLPRDDDPAIERVIHALEVIVDNGRQGSECCYLGVPHTLGLMRHCALCQGYNALQALAQVRTRCAARPYCD